MKAKAPWAGVFEVLDPDGDQTPLEGIPLMQIDAYDFLVGAQLRYLGDTGLDPALDDQIRDLPLDLERTTDLASVPKLMRWFVNTYGVHTPAALFHDKYASRTRSPIGPVEADTYFRAMLKALGVPRFKRYIMWTAVAGRTRWMSSMVNKILIVLWVAASTAGLVFFSGAVFGAGWASPRVLVLIVAGLAPLPASLLWGRQKLAALIAAAAAIWLLPVAFIGLLGITAYKVSEKIVSWALD